MSLRLIETFIEAARLGSFSAAGRTLGLSPGSVSQNIKHLEEQLGVKLFERTTRQVRLTREGERYRSHCAPALEALAAAAEVVREERDSVSGTLRVTAATAFGRQEIVGLIASFQRLHPALAIELRLSDQFADLVAEGFDVAIRGGVLPENEYIAKLLLPVTPLLCAAPAYLAEHGVPASLEQLCRHRLVGMRSAATGQVVPWQFAPSTGREQMEIAPSFIVNELAGVLRAATMGMGIAQIASNVALPAIAAGELVPILAQTAVTSRGVYAVYPSRRFVPKKTSLFIAHLADAFANRPDLVWPGPDGITSRRKRAR